MASEFRKMREMYQRPTGKWISKCTPGGAIYYECSNCKKGQSVMLTPFCPLCGAKLEG